MESRVGYQTSHSVIAARYAHVLDYTASAMSARLTAALALVGIAVAFPIALGLSIVVSTILNYMINPRGDPEFLFSQVALVLVAVIFGSLAHRAREAHSDKSSRKGVFLSFCPGILFCGFAPLAGAIDQASSLVAAIWDVFVWREFRGALLRAKLLLVCMFCVYIGDIALVASSR